MIALVSGQNIPWPDGRLTASVSGAEVRTLALGADDRARDAADLGVALDLAALSPEVSRVLVVATRFAGTPSVRLDGADGRTVAEFTPARLDGETALVLVEVYRRNGEWKVRALGQGYRGGLPELLQVHGLPPMATPPPPAVGPDPLRQLGMIMEDASRSTAALLSSTQFAERRLEQELETLVADPSLRVGSQADAAREAAVRRRDDLVRQAAARHVDDFAHLAAEVTELERALPAPAAVWTADAWRQWSVPPAPVGAFRVGELALPDLPSFRLPWLWTVPYRRPAWIASAGSDDAAVRQAGRLAVRIAAALAPGVPLVTVLDVGGRHDLGLGVFATTVTDAARVPDVLAEHLRHADLVTLAARSGTVDALPPEHRQPRVLVLLDFPTGVGEAGVDQVRRLASDGPDGGVLLLLTGTPPGSVRVPALDLLFGDCVVLPDEPGGELVDDYGGVAWTFHPDQGPEDPRLLTDVVRSLLA